MQVSDLVPGNVYFILTYSDKDMRIPTIQTLIYRRQGLSDSGTPLLFFLEVQANPSQDDEEIFVRESDLELLVLDREGLINRLSTQAGE